MGSLMITHGNVIPLSGGFRSHPLIQTMHGSETFMPTTKPRKNLRTTVTLRGQVRGSATRGDS